MALALYPAVQTSAADRLLEQPVRVRIAWGGPPEAAFPWVGRIAVEGGKFGDMQLLGMEADAAASVWQEKGEIRIAAVTPHRFDGVDVTISAAEDARLKIELFCDPSRPPVKADVLLREALRKPFHLPLDALGNELLVQRAPGDELRIEIDRDVLIFAPRETFSFAVRPVLDALEPSTTIDVQTRLTPARGDKAIWTDEQRLPVPVDADPVAALAVPLPADEGVYTIHITLARPPGFRDRFFPTGSNKPLAERQFQIVVLRPQPEPPGNAGDWQPVLEIDPANPRWWQRLPDWTQVSRLPGITPRPLGSIRAGAIDHPLGRFIELPPTHPGDEPHWQAYPLPIEKTGVPHLLEVEYPADEEQYIGLSILEPNAAGRAVPVGRDSGVYVEGLGRSENVNKHVHKLVFWPRTNSPLLLVTNQHSGAVARFGRIRVLRQPGSLAGSAQSLPWREANRLVAAYVARPLVPETFGATERLDTGSGQSVDDWQMFYEGATRLAEYLSFAGYNAAAASVLADGSAIFPGKQMSSTPLYDTGRMVGNGDLPATDALELTLRVFDGHGLAMFPAVQLAAPLQELEPMRRNSDSKTSGLEWVGPDGRSWLEVHGTSRGLAPYYNLLDSRVQQAVENVVREIIERYGGHPSLAGLAVQLSGDGFAELPGLEWGLDDRTIAQFERETGIRLAGDGPNRFAARHAQLLGEHVDAWRAWRAGRVTQFYGRLAELVRATDLKRRLLLTTEEALARPQLETRLRPNVLASTPIARVLLDLGIDEDQLSATPGIVLCRTRFVEPATPLVDRAIDLQISDSFSSLSGEAPGNVSGSMFYHRPTRQRMASFDAKSPLDSYTLLVTHSLPDAAAARRAYAMVLDDGDPTVVLDGGELLPLGQEDAVRGVRAILQRLPIGADAATLREQPVTVRCYAERDRTTLLVINECPWRADAEVSLDVPQQAIMEPLAAIPKSAQSRILEAGQQSWKLQLEPYDVQAVHIATAGVTVAGIHATVSDAARKELESRLAELGDRDLTAASVYSVLVNPGFEPTGGEGPVPGWQPVGTAASPAMELDATTPHAGKTCLYLAGGQAVAAVQSDTFATPPTGQLAMTVFVRAENVDPTTQLRLIFEAERAGEFYRRIATVGGNRPGAQPLDSQWRSYVFGVNDVPLDSQGQMRIRFELAGPGEVWIDEVQLHDLLFPLRFYENSSQERLELVKLVLAARNAHENGRLTDCVRLLESYWPRFMMSYTPSLPPAATPPPPAPVAEKPEEKTPSLTERIKGYVPSILRF